MHRDCSSAQPAQLKAPERHRLRFPASFLVRGAQDELFVARRMWLFALPAQWYVLYALLDKGDVLYETILFSILCLFIFTMVGRSVAGLSSRIFQEDIDIAALTISIAICWIGATVIDAILFVYLLGRFSLNNSYNYDYLATILQFFLEKTAGTSFYEAHEALMRYARFVWITGLTTIISCISYLSFVYILTSLGIYNNEATEYKKNPPVVLVWLSTWLPLAAIYSLAMSTKLLPTWFS